MSLLSIRVRSMFGSATLYIPFKLPPRGAPRETINTPTDMIGHKREDPSDG